MRMACGNGRGGAGRFPDNKPGNKPLEWMAFIATTAVSPTTAVLDHAKVHVRRGHIEYGSRYEMVEFYL